MDLIAALMLTAGVYPMAKAARANRDTTLRHALGLALIAWLTWILVAWARLLLPERQHPVSSYIALCMSGCTGIAVLGARRPGVAAWNFVVAGLFAVLLLPLLNGMGELRLELAQEIFLTVTLLVPVLNYLPTRLALSAVLAASGWGWELARLWDWTTPERFPWFGLVLLASAPWTAWTIFVTSSPALTELDRLWLSYRDRFGFVWGQRMREQFNRAAHHAGWPVVMRWGGLQETANASIPDTAALVALLRAVLKRFGPEDEELGEGGASAP